MVSDTYSAQLIARCRALSPGIDEYFAEERYRSELDPEDEVTPQYLLDAAISLVMDRLRDMGIESNLSVGELLDSSYDLETMFYLASKFDADNYMRVLKCFDEQQMFEYSSMLENIDLAEDYLYDISDFFNQLMPTDVGWEYISRSTDRWCSTDEFVTHIAQIQMKVEVNKDPIKITIEDDQLEIVKRFLEVMSERDQKVRAYVAYIFDRFRGMLNREKLMRMVKKYDKEKLHPDKIILFAKWNAMTKEQKDSLGAIPQFLDEHHHHDNHHIEYWEADKGKHEITAEIAVMIVISLILDNLPASKLFKELSRYENIASEQMLMFMHTLCKEVPWKQLTGEVA